MNSYGSEFKPRHQKFVDVRSALRNFGKTRNLEATKERFSEKLAETTETKSKLQLIQKLV